MPDVGVEVPPAPNTSHNLNATLYCTPAQLLPSVSHMAKQSSCVAMFVSRELGMTHSA